MQKPQFFFQKLPDAIKMIRIQLSSAISKKYKIIFFFFCDEYYSDNSI